MKPVKHKLVIYQGKTFEEPFRFQEKVSGTVIDMTGWTGRMQIRTAADAADFEIELTTENERIIIDEDAGKVTLYLTDDLTAALTPGSYVYDLELVTATGRVYGPLYGGVSVKAEVTKVVPDE